MATLNFPQDPVFGDVYEFASYTYKWDGEKWKTIGTGSNPTNELRAEVFSKLDITNTYAIEALRKSYAEAGYNLVSGSFGIGGVLESSTDVLLNETDGKGYAWTGAFPKVASPGTDPTLPGSGYVPRTDVVLRAEITPSITEALRRSYAGAGLTLVSGSFEEGGTLTGPMDVLLYKANGKAYSGPAGAVSAGTDPTNGGFVDKSGNLLRDKKQQINYQYSAMGKAFGSEDGAGDKFASWTHATVAYDADADDFVIVYNTNSGHNINTNSVLMRKKKTNSDAFSSAVVVASDKEIYSYKCQAAGIAANGDYVALVARFPWGSGNSDATFVYRSTDKGQTFTRTQMLHGSSPVVAFNGDVSGFLVTNSGRILTFAVEYDTYLTRIFYSDDNGSTWSKSTIGGSPMDITEPAWCDVGDGKLVCMARAAVRTGDTSTIIPAKFMTSSDNGVTWTAPVDSQSITNFTLSNGEMIPDYDSKTIEFIHHSRHTEEDNYSSLLRSTASFNDALIDKFSPQVRIGKLAAYTALGTSTGDSGYVGAKRSKNGVINAFYYTGSRVDAQINYLVGTPDTAYSAQDRVLDPATGNSLLSAESPTYLLTPVLENGQLNPKAPTAFAQGFDQGTAYMSQATCFIAVTGADGSTVRRSSWRTLEKISFDDVSKIIVSIESFAGNDVAIALYDIADVYVNNANWNRKFFAATKQAGDFVADVSNINGAYWLHVVLNSSTDAQVAINGIYLEKKSNTPMHKQNPSRIIFDGGLKMAGLGPVTNSVLRGAGTGTTDIGSMIAHGATSTSSEVFTRLYLFQNAIKAGIVAVSAKLMYSSTQASTDFDAGIAIFNKINPTNSSDGRVAFSFVSGDGGLLSLKVPDTGGPYYVGLVANAKLQGKSAIAYFDQVITY